MIEHMVPVETPSGRMNTFVCHPDRGGPHPVVLFLMDAPGIREELREMARRLATVGYYVVLPNLYYRHAPDELGDWTGGAAVRARIGTLMETTTMATVLEDVEALVDFIDGDEAASTDRMGALGYCMSGKFAVAATVRQPRIVAAASIYGTGLVGGGPDSVHLQIGVSRAELYFAWAELDGYAPVSQVPVLREAMRESAVRAEVEVYRGANHGFAFRAFSTFDREASDRHWERLFELFGRTLGSGRR